MLPLILTSVLLSTAAQLAFKYGMMRPEMQAWLLAGRFDVRSLLRIPVNIPLASGFLMYGVGACIWLLVLARINVSVAYPFVGLGFIATMLAGVMFLGEPITSLRVAGTLLIALGVVLVAR